MKNLFLICILIYIFGCKTNLQNYEDKKVNPFQFHHSDKEKNHLKIKKNLLILTFEDLRSKEDIDNRLITFIPFVLYGNVISTRPEYDFNYKLDVTPQIDYANALTSELKNYLAFDSVEYTDRKKTSKLEYQILCKIHKNLIKGKYTSFGSSTFFLTKNWGLGVLFNIYFPTLFYKIETEIELEILKNKEIIYTKSFYNTDSNFKIENGFSKYEQFQDFNELNFKTIHEIAKDIFEFFERNPN